MQINCQSFNNYFRSTSDSTMKSPQVKQIMLSQKHTFPVISSDSWRVHMFTSVNELSFKANESPKVPVVCDESCL